MFRVFPDGCLVPSMKVKIKGTGDHDRNSKANFIKICSMGSQWGSMAPNRDFMTWCIILILSPPIFSQFHNSVWNFGIKKGPHKRGHRSPILRKMLSGLLRVHSTFYAILSHFKLLILFKKRLFLSIIFWLHFNSSPFSAFWRNERPSERSLSLWIKTLPILSSIFVVAGL